MRLGNRIEQDEQKSDHGGWQATRLAVDATLISPSGVRYRVLDIGRERITLRRLDGDAAYTTFDTAIANIERYGYSVIMPETSYADGESARDRP